MKRHILALQAGLKLLSEDGFGRVINEGKSYLQKSKWRTIHSINGEVNKGINIFDKDWDLFIVLDACRVDAMEEVADEYAFLESINTSTSLGSNSKEWISRNFTSEVSSEISETAYITGNPFSEKLLDEDQWYCLQEVWKESWDSKEGTIHPQPITDKAISVARNSSPENIIIHYMQPHTPFVGFSESGHHDLDRWDKKGYLEKSEWEKLRDGEIDFSTIWTAYLDNLRYVLDDVEILLNNIDAENVVISADHGECAGEYGLYGHPEGIAIDELREVPWVSTTAKDSKERIPEAREDEITVTREEQLKQLGYK